MKIKEVQVPRKVLNSTFEFLRKYGKYSLESHALWVGNDESNIFCVSDVWFPKQYNSSISYEVPEKEVHRINVELNELDLTAIAQVHTHPSSAFHSCTDDHWSMLVLPGSFSIVIPNYGFIKEDNLNEWSIYRYNGREWLNVYKKEVKVLFQII